MRTADANSKAVEAVALVELSRALASEDIDHYLEDLVETAFDVIEDRLSTLAVGEGLCSPGERLGSLWSRRCAALAFEPPDSAVAVHCVLEMPVIRSSRRLGCG